MHKLFFIGLVVLISAFEIQAQSFKGGVLFGLTTCQVDGDQLAGYNKPGPIGGLYVYRSMGKNFDLQMDMTYVQKGARLTPKPQNGNQFRLIRLHYAEVPITARYKNGNFGYEAGLSFGALLGSYVGTEFGETPESALNPPFFRAEYAIHAGMGMRITDRWSTFWRISYSILPVRDFPGGRSVLSRAGQYNNVLHFTLRYLLSKPEPMKEFETKI
jgi:hypothetical protein